jgi:hypothetical protein
MAKRLKVSRVTSHGGIPANKLRQEVSNDQRSPVMAEFLQIS